jgi:hypothetical protein
MPYRIAGLDVHKKMLAVVVANVEEVDGVDRPVLAVGVGSAGTALAPQTPRACRRPAPRGHAPSRPRPIESRAGGRKKDFPDAERLVKRLVAQELTLSSSPTPSGGSGAP